MRWVWERYWDYISWQMLERFCLKQISEKYFCIAHTHIQLVEWISNFRMSSHWNSFHYRNVVFQYWFPDTQMVLVKPCSWVVKRFSVGKRCCVNTSNLIFHYYSLWFMRAFLTAVSRGKFGKEMIKIESFTWEILIAHKLICNEFIR